MAHWGKKNVPGACVQGSREFYARDSLNDGGFSSALDSENTDCGNINVGPDAGGLSDCSVVAFSGTHPVECTWSRTSKSSWVSSTCPMLRGPVGKVSDFSPGGLPGPAGEERG